MKKISNVFKNENQAINMPDFFRSWELCFTSLCEKEVNILADLYKEKHGMLKSFYWEVFDIKIIEKKFKSGPNKKIKTGEIVEVRFNNYFYAVEYGLDVYCCKINLIEVKN
jgi:hypothetical protein